MMLEARGLVLRRGGRCLARGLSFVLDAGRGLRVQGANGAGKTTLLRTVCGLRPPGGGELRWRGEALPAARARLNAELLYLGHRDALHEELDPGENLRVALALAGEPAAPGAVERALDEAGLGAQRRLPVRCLSQGQRRRAALARLALTRRRLWVLDEPLAALDADACQALLARLKNHLEQGGLALLTCHDASCWNIDSIRPLSLCTPAATPQPA